ncbi:hypothetical protein P153DRAFT_148540 [Dothidotthia symphoricarpi CBS 119687]|uniref:Uncharacterized protein n=1 Tax=Dothidotthia symphoricarpi CBS 119687 TaxID=1392245 RepID=A0A6A5ZXW7_9PLEO|nr:uncharacterized protein P153DRAFT_148540 [Dothidotthia symphoricarpi CBS 119687]KAF2123617.1 hypothetical protein P153DRAFT_148540 [Dothidotthia symphoricarpi CBS 119687]
MDSPQFSPEFHIVAINLVLFYRTFPNIVESSPTNNKCLPLLEIYNEWHPVQEVEALTDHPQYQAKLHKEWLADNHARRIAFKTRFKEVMQNALDARRDSESIDDRAEDTASPSDSPTPAQHPISPVDHGTIVRYQPRVNALPAPVNKPSLLSRVTARGTQLLSHIGPIPVPQLPIGPGLTLQRPYRAPTGWVQAGQDAAHLEQDGSYENGGIARRRRRDEHDYGLDDGDDGSFDDRRVRRKRY